MALFGHSERAAQEEPRLFREGRAAAADAAARRANPPTAAAFALRTIAQRKTAMSGQTDPKTAQDRADHDAEIAVEGTFPASDPTANKGTQGARAVPPEELMHASGSKPHGDTASLTARFDSMETAKLAVEAMVRDGPVDRRCAEVEDAGGAATVRLSVPQADRERLGAMLQRQPGRTG